MSERFRQFEAYLDCEMTPAEFSEFEAWLVEDQSHAEQFLHWTALECQIVDALRVQAYQQVLNESGEFIPETSGGASSDPSGPAPSERGGGRRPWLNSSQSLLAAAMTLAASVILAVVFVSPRTANNRADRASARESLAAADRAVSDSTETIPSDAEVDRETPVAVATLTSVVDAVWGASCEPLEPGQTVAGNTRIVLLEGVVKCAFDSGAEVVVEAPCDFLIEGPMNARLSYGSLSARVPRRASGFLVRSDLTEVVDLGTEFGFSVVQGGPAEVHVFSGEVLSRTRAGPGDQQSHIIRLHERDGLRFNASHDRPVRITADEQKFVRNASHDATPEQAGQLPVKRRLALWLAADFNLQRDEKGRVVAWRDAVCGDNVSAEDALQMIPEARPEWISEAIGGQPAVRFDGKQTYLVTTPLATTDNQTVFLVGQFSRNAVRRHQRPGGQMLNYNGPPHRVLSTTYEPGVLQIGEPILHDFAPTRIRAKVYAGEVGNVGVSEGRIIAPAVGAERPVIISYVYDNQRNRSVLAIDGRTIGVGTARSPAGVVSRKVLGRHGFDDLFFDGDIAEVLIYNEAMSVADQSLVTEALGRKYGIRIHRGDVPRNGQL